MPVPLSLPERYRVTGHVASGGMAAVYAARDELLGRDVAVKVLAEHLTEDPKAAVRFQREARAAAGLSSHPHVVTIYDVGEHEGRAFIVMELLKAGSLADLLRSGRTVDRPTAIRWLRDAASALDAAHTAGIVHRDVKPANLLLDDRGGLAIADFGIARIAQEDGVTMTGQVLGTASYLSPEQALGESATAASDRYALAVVAFQLLTGRRPFTGEHFASQARAHIDDPPPHASEVGAGLPRSIDPVLDRGLAKAPEDRWPTATAFVDALEAALDDDEAATATQRMAPLPATSATVPAAAAAPAPPPPPPRRRAPVDSPPRRREPPPAPPAPEPRGRPWAVVLGVLAALLVAGVAIAALSSGSSDDPPASKRTRTSTRAKREKTPTPTPTPTAAATETPTPTATPSPTETPAPAGGSDVASARPLNDRGYKRYQAGDYAGAVPILQRAVDACGQSTEQDPCAYALYNLGSALHRSGRSAEAIPYLERRLAISDFQRKVVESELDAARAQAGGGDDKGNKGKG